MPPSPIPAPLPPWARFLLQVLPFIAATLQEALQYIGEMGDASAGQNSEWMHVQLVAKNKVSTEASDRAITTMDIVNITNGAIDNSWIQADFDTVGTALFNLQTAWASHMGSGYEWLEQRYYRRAFNPLSNPEPFTKGGPPVLVSPTVIVGTSSLTAPRQAAITSTDKSAYPRHWGRNYWPFPGGGQFDVNGYVPNVQVDALASALETAYQTLQAAEFFPVIAVTQVQGVPTRGLLGVSSVQVDNNPDIQRRRRPKFTTYRKVLP